MATGHTPSRKHPEYWGGEIPWISVKDARPFDGGVITTTHETTNELGIANSAAVVLPRNTVCLSRTGSIGYTIRLGGEMATSQGFVNWICGDSLDPRFLQYLLRAEKSFLKRISEGVAHTTIYFPEAKAFHVAVPDRPTQDELSSYLDTQFSRLAAAETNLQRAKTNLERYRRSILHAACTGKLAPTEASLAKAEGRTYEHASKLLERILVERRAKWEEAELEKYAAKGKTPPKGWQSKYKEPVAPDVEGLPELPEGWCWATMDQICAVARPICYGILKPGPNQDGGVPYVEVKDLRGDVVNLASIHRTTRELADQFARSYLQEGDLLIAVRGTYGRVGITPQELEGGNVSRDVVRAVVSPNVNRAFARYALLSDVVQTYWQIHARGVAVKGVNVGTLKETPVPLPPRVEQEGIVDALEALLSLADEHSCTILASLARANSLRQSILQSVFGASND